MSNLLLLVPAAASIAADGGVGAAFLATPDPKEAWVSPIVGATTSASIALDLGSAQLVDTVFAGYTDLPATGSIDVAYGDTPALGGDVGRVPVVPSRFGPQHALMHLAAPISARYLRLDIRHGAADRAITVGVAAAGLGFQPLNNFELGSGRSIGDTGSATRMFGGGFAIEEGTGFAGWSCTLSDLDDDEREAIYIMLRRIKTTRSLLLVEDPDATAGLNERTHWCLMAKLDPYERRRDVSLNRYGLSVQTWA